VAPLQDRGKMKGPKVRAKNQKSSYVMPKQSDNSLFVGKVAIRHKRLDSTNRYALDFLSKSLPTEGTAIIADEQWAGRGQKGNAWLSEAGQNIALSLILRPKFLLIKEQFLWNIAISLAVHEVLTNCQLKLPHYIKWPNDVYVGNFKVGGILIENQLRASYLDWSVVGIGLNILQKSFPANLPNPSSLALSSNKKLNIDSILSQLFLAIERLYLKLRQGQNQDLWAQYESKLWRYKEWAKFRWEGQEQEGRIWGVAPTGQLKIIDRQGQLRLFNFKEVEYIL